MSELDKLLGKLSESMRVALPDEATVEADDEVVKAEKAAHLEQVRIGNEVCLARDPHVAVVDAGPVLGMVRLSSELQKKLSRMASGEDQNDARMF
jgi:hypothetical protein